MPGSLARSLHQQRRALSFAPEVVRKFDELRCDARQLTCAFVRWFFSFTFAGLCEESSREDQERGVARGRVVGWCGAEKVNASLFFCVQGLASRRDLLRRCFAG